MVRSKIPLIAFILFSVALLVLCVSGFAHAAISSVIASPNSAQVDVTRASSVTAGWIIKGVANGTVQSKQVVFRNEAGKIIGTVNQPLSASLNATGDATLTDTVVVPESVVVKVHLGGSTKFVYERAFSDGGAEVARHITLHIIASAGTGLRRAVNPDGSTNSFDISRLTLSFEKSPVAVIRRGDKLSAKAKVAYSSTGILNAAWQVAGPNPGDQPEFRSLGTINQLTDKSGEIVFQSPVLPAFAEGVYVVRFDMTTPALPFDVPEIRYVVTDK
jgi:hypothetical protein